MDLDKRNNKEKTFAENKYLVLEIHTTITIIFYVLSFCLIFHVFQANWTGLVDESRGILTY